MGRAGGPGDRHRAARVLNGTRRRLIDGYGGIICDLDGVVYRGRLAVPGAIETLASLAREGIHVTFATNNASRTPDEVRDHLYRLGLDVPAGTVVTSAQAAASYVAATVPVGTSVLAVGGPGVTAALLERGLRPLTRSHAARAPKVVVQGAGRDVSWTDLAEAAYAVQAGAMWVATNRDLTIPMRRGLAPGNGTLVAAVTLASSVEPIVVGKPNTALYELAAARLGLSLREVLVVGDRLDTDIQAARTAGIDSVLVLSGAHGLSDIEAAAPAQLPTYVAPDLSGLLDRPIRVENSRTLGVQSAG